MELYDVIPDDYYSMLLETTESFRDFSASVLKFFRSAYREASGRIETRDYDSYYTSVFYFDYRLLGKMYKSF